MLISSHLLGEIEQMVDQVGILNHGKLLFEGSLQQLQKHSRGGVLLRVLDAPKAAAVLQQQGVKAAHRQISRTPCSCPRCRTKRWRHWSAPCRKRRGCGGPDGPDKEP